VATLLQHERAREMFSQLVDHELPPVEEEALRTHLSSCEDCKQGLARYERAVHLVRSVERERVPVDFASHVLRRVRKRRRLLGWQGGRFLDHVSWPAQAAIIVLLAAAFVALYLLFASQH